ncbi:polymorphic toxin-type HINT domain-containing protein, partial [Streptomyces bacillaris]
KAAADANRYADNAEASAFSAQFSADYARNSAVEARKSANRAHASALAANKSKEEAAADAKAAWDRTEKLLKAELEEAKRQAEEEFKRQQQVEEDRRKRTCHIPLTERGDAAFLNCVKRNGDEAIVAGIEMPQFLRDLALEISGIQGVLDCIDSPAFTQCAIAFAEVIPAGKLLKLRKLDKLEDVAQKVRLRKACDTCFLAGTKVLMAGGQAKNIEDIQPNDQVVATDPATGNTSLQQVTRQIITKDDKWFNELTIATPDGPETLNPTYEHPFWSPSEKAWIKAADLQKGMTLRAPDSSKPVKVQTNRSYSLAATTYNLSVAEVHTYYVLAGNTPVLVHNSDGWCGIWQSEFDSLPRGKQGHVREMPDERAMRDAFERWTADAEQLPARGPKIPDVYRLEDGTVMQWRTASASGGATIDIQPGNGGKPWKVHLP